MEYNYDYIYHHGVKGMKWGVRRFQNEDGSLKTTGKKRYADEAPKTKSNPKSKPKANNGTRSKASSGSRKTAKKSNEKIARKTASVVAKAGKLTLVNAARYYQNSKTIEACNKAMSGDFGSALISGYTAASVGRSMNYLFG